MDDILVHGKSQEELDSCLVAVLRHLQEVGLTLNEKNQWCWEDPQERAFMEIKQEISRSPVLAFFDPGLETTVSADGFIKWPWGCIA